jgi:hypothetical protein
MQVTHPFNIGDGGKDTQIPEHRTCSTGRHWSQKAAWLPPIDFSAALALARECDLMATVPETSHSGLANRHIQFSRFPPMPEFAISLL